MKRVGVLGTFVWDEIWHPATGDAPVEQWGGLAYSLAAFAAGCPPGWSVEPIAHVGRDLALSALAFVASLPNIASTRGLRLVPEPNNRVTLRYHDFAEREETLTGGVKGWDAEALIPLVADLDALYLNFLAGNELDLATAGELRSHLGIPIYADLHSLFLGPPGSGPRPTQRLPDWEHWLGCFDHVQLNQSELALLGPERENALSLLPLLPEHGPDLVLVTRGGDGASYARRRAAGEESRRDSLGFVSDDGKGTERTARFPGGDATGGPVGDGATTGTAGTADAAGTADTADTAEAAGTADPAGTADGAGTADTTGTGEASEIEIGTVHLPHGPLSGDPTGCGDVWGSVVFSGLLGGLALEEAMRRAHRAAAAKLRTRRIENLAASVGEALGEERPSRSVHERA